MKKLFVLLLVLIPSLTYAQIKREREIAFMHFLDKEYSESFKEYSRLAQFGNSEDLESLAQHYHYGYGTERDINLAIMYYKMAANKGEELSQAQLCEFYSNGIATATEQQKRDLYKYSRMFSSNLHYSSSTNSTDDNARYSLYLCYKNGWGTHKNPLLADIWLTFAACNDAMKAQDEFCSIYGLDGNYNTDEEETALMHYYIQHLYEKIQPYIQNDKSVEATYFKIFYLFSQKTQSSALEGIKETISLYDDNKLDNEGKAFLYDIIAPIAKLDENLKNRYEKDAEKYELVSDEDKNTWHHVQLTKVVWKIDVMLNKSYTQTGIINGHNWVDLGLPSGTKWATCNIDADNPYASGSFYAWAETRKKREYTPENYNADSNNMILNGNNDVAHLFYGTGWSVPSCEDWRELLLYCDIEYNEQRNAIYVKSPNGQFIVLPMTQNSEMDGIAYWTNTRIPGLHDPQEGSAAALILETQPVWGIIFADIWRGCLIRPVLK